MWFILISEVWLAPCHSLSASDTPKTLCDLLTFKAPPPR